MTRRFIQVATLLAISLLFIPPDVLARHAIVQGFVGDNGKGFSTVRDPSITIGSSWFATATVPPAFFWTGGDGTRSSSGPFTFSCDIFCAITFGGFVHVRVTDDFCKGDVFEVFDNNVSIGTTSFVPVGPCPVSDVGPDAAYADPTYSSGCFTIGALGSHAIDIVAKISPFGSGRAYLDVHGGICPGPRFLGIEVTQSIQYFRDIGDAVDRNPGVPDNSIFTDPGGHPEFVKNKPTLVRVYVNSNGPPLAGTVTLRAVDPATGLDLSPPRITINVVAVPSPARSRLQDTANFLLPATHPWVGVPGVRFQAEFHKIVSSYLQVSFIAKPIFRIGFVQVRYCPNGNGNGVVDAGETCYFEPMTPDPLVHPAHVCPATDPCTGGNVPHTHPNIRAGHLFAQAMLPFPEIQFIPLGGEVILDANLNDAAGTNANTLLSRLETRLTLENFARSLRCIFLFICDPLLDRIYGWVPYLDVPNSAKFSGNGMQDWNRAMFGNANNIDPTAAYSFPYGKWRRTLAHELVHTFGQVHDFVATDEYGWDSEFGANVVTFMGNVIGAVKSRDSLDIMYPGQPELKAWIRPSTYQAVWNKVDPPEQPLATPVQGIIMTGRFDNVTKVFHLDPFWTTPLPFIPKCPSSGPSSIEFRSSNGTVLQRCFINPIGPVEDNDCPSTALCPSLLPAFNVATVYPPATASIVVMSGNQTLNTVTVSAHAPMVTIKCPPLCPGTTVGDTLPIDWKATDADGNPLTCNVLFSTDGGTTFRPMGDSINGTAFTLDTRQFAGGASRAIQVACSDGVNVGQATVGGLTLAKKVPVASIELPGQVFTQVSTQPQVLLTGSAHDAEDGELPDSSLSWFASSSNPRPLGNGKSLLVNLPEGQHTIILSAKDSDGNVVNATTTITVQGITALFEQDFSDYDNNGVVSITDISQAAFFFDKPNTYFDLNLNGKVDVTEMAVLAFHFDQPVGPSPDTYYGKGQPVGQMDPAWRTLCIQLPTAYQPYCQTRI